MMEKKIICLIGDTRHDAPDAANVLSNLVRVCTLELGKLCRALDLEEHLFSPGRDDLKLWHRRVQRDIPNRLIDQGYAYFHIDCFTTLRVRFNIWGLGWHLLLLGHC